MLVTSSEEVSTLPVPPSLLQQGMGTDLRRQRGSSSSQHDEILLDLGGRHVSSSFPLERKVVGVLVGDGLDLSHHPAASTYLGVCLLVLLREEGGGRPQTQSTEESCLSFGFVSSEGCTD